MKKAIAILLAAMMALAMVACGNDPAPTPTPDPEPTTGILHGNSQDACKYFVDML